MTAVKPLASALAFAGDTTIVFVASSVDAGALMAIRGAEAPVVVRPLLKHEVPRLAEAVWDGTSLAQIENRWTEQEMGYRAILVAERDGELLGTVSIHPTGEPPDTLHLFALDVGAEWRGHGIGTAIVEHVIEEARRRGLKRVQLEVRTDNPARRLYHRLGFRRTGKAFMNSWLRFEEDGSKTRVEELSYRMVKRVR
jgi:ribosomal protein S18 acetylase RimI-like enzyme